MANTSNIFTSQEQAEQVLKDQTEVRLGNTFTGFQSYLEGREDYYMELLPSNIQEWLLTQAEEQTETFLLIQGKSISMDGLHNIMDTEIGGHITYPQAGLTYHLLHLEW